MPLREYKCSCGHSFDELYSNKYPKHRKCPICGEQAVYVFSAVTFRLDFRDGWDQGAGAYFDSARQRDTHLDKNNLVKVPDGAFDQAFGEKVHGG